MPQTGLTFQTNSRTKPLKKASKLQVLLIFTNPLCFDWACMLFLFYRYE